MVSHSAEGREATAAAVAAIPTILTGAVDSVSLSNAEAQAPRATLAALADPAWGRKDLHAADASNPYSSSKTASCNAGLTRAIALLSGVGCTRLVSSVT